MKKVTFRCRWTFLFALVLSFVCLLGGGQKVAAASDTQETCKVIFADAKGVTSAEYYQKLSRTVEKGSVIELPKVNRNGYKAVWVTKNDGHEYKYSAGEKVAIENDIKFCLNLYKEYTVRFYTANGKNEYKSLRKTVTAGSSIRMPSGNSSENYSFQGWATKAGGSVSKKRGATVKVKSNLKFYAVQQKISTSGVRLYKNDGTYWKTIKNTDGRTTFPIVDLKNGDMVLGWSKTKGKSTLSNADCRSGARVPSKRGRYYMVVFRKSMDKAPSVITQPTKYDRVYCVGDSRTVDTKLALGASVPSNVEIIAKGRQGLDWFKSTAYRQLLHSVSSRPQSEKKAVIINLGVNDLKNVNAYIPYMRRVSEKLEKYNCKMYYLSVNPINSEMVKRAGAGRRTEEEIATFNRVIYQKLCTGKNKSFTYINSCTNLQMKGWISNRYNSGRYDGLHYSNETYLRIFDYCMRYLNR